MLANDIPLIPTLALAILSLIASSFVIIRTLLPILPPHPLSQRLPRQAFGLEKRFLTPAQKATLYIAASDLVALGAFVWQAIAEYFAARPLSPSSSGAAAARLWVALTARQTCLLVVALLALTYVRMGKTLTYGTHDFFVWAPTVFLVILSTAFASAFAGAHIIHSFFIGSVLYISVIGIASTTAFVCLLVSLVTIRRNLAASALEREPWPPKVARRPGSFATEDIDALRGGSSWITSVRSDRESVSAFSFSTSHSSAAAASSNNPYSNSIPAKSSYWFNGAASTQNLTEPEQPVAPETEGAATSGRPTSSPLGVEADPFRRAPPGSIHSESSTATYNSWLTERSGSVATMSQFSFPTTRPSSPAPSLPSDHGHEQRYGGHLSTAPPGSTTAFSPSPRASSEQYRNRDSDDRLIKSPVLGGYGPSQSDTESGRGSADSAPNLTAMRMLGWMGGIWVPFVFSMPYLVLNAVPTAFNTAIPAIFLVLSVTLSAPILAVHVMYSSPIPVAPAELFAPVSRRESLMGCTEANTTASTGPALPYDMVARSASQLTVVDGRRSGDIWVEKGHADENRSKFARALSMVAPNPKLSTLTTPGEPQDEDARPPTPPAKSSSSQVSFPVKNTSYNADPIVAAASDILVKEAASKAERTRLESKASSYYSGADESLAHQTKIMIAQRHYSTMALASTVTVPPSPGATSTSGSTMFNVDGGAASGVNVSPAVSVFSKGPRASIASSSMHLRSRSASSVAQSISMPSRPFSPPPAFPLPPTPTEARFNTHGNGTTTPRSTSSLSSRYHGRSQSHSSAGFGFPSSPGSSEFTFEIDALTAGVLPQLRPDVKIGKDVKVRPEWQGGFAGPQYSPPPFEIDEDDVEELISGVSSLVGLAMKTPPSKSSKSSKKSMDIPLPENMSFSSPENHSTPKSSVGGARKKQHTKNHMSLPSLGMGANGSESHAKWTEEIAKALEHYNVPTTNSPLRRNTIYGSESPAKRARTHVEPSASKRVPTALDLPPIARRFSVDAVLALDGAQTLTVDNQVGSERNVIVTPISNANFIVPHADGTPLAVAVKEEAVVHPRNFHLPSMPVRKSSITYVTSKIRANNERQIAIYNDTQDPTTTTSTTTTTAINVKGPRAWPPNDLARVRQQTTIPAKSALRPLSLLQGKDLNSTIPVSSSSEEKSSKRTSVVMTSTPVSGPQHRKRKSNGGRDENKTPASAKSVKSSGLVNSGNVKTKSSGIKPLRLARSATSKARGVLRGQEVLPEVVVRPPSTSAHNGFTYSFNR